MFEHEKINNKLTYTSGQQFQTTRVMHKGNMVFEHINVYK